MAIPTNKDRLKNSSDEELLSLIKGMRLDNLKDNEILKVLKNGDTRSAFRKYMFGEDSKIQKAQEAVSEMDSTFKEIQGTKKRKYGLFSDVKRKSLERKQSKNNKTIISAMESSVKKTHKKEALSRTFTMSKGKKILSLRTEKQTLKASMDYADDLIKHYIKQGESQDSKNIVELKRFVEESENALASVNDEIYKVKGGAKFAEKRIQSLSASFAVVGEELSAKQEEFNAKILEKQEQMTELLGDGFDEQSEVIKQLQKDLIEAEKDKEEALKEITDKQEEINKEISYLRARGDKVGVGGFGVDFDKDGKRRPKGGGGSDKTKKPSPKDLVKKGGRSLLKNPYGLLVAGLGFGAKKLVDNIIGDNQPKSSAEKHRLETSYAGKTDNAKMALFMQGVKAVESYSKLPYDDAGFIAIGNGINLKYQTIKEMQGYGLSPQALSAVTPFLDTGARATPTNLNKAKTALTPAIVDEIALKVTKNKYYSGFEKMVNDNPYIKGLTTLQMAMLGAAYHNADYLTKKIVYANSNIPSFLKQWDREFLTSGRVRTKEGYLVRAKYNIRNPNAKLKFTDSMMSQPGNLSKYGKDMNEYIEKTTPKQPTQPKQQTQENKQVTQTPTLTERRLQAHAIDRTQDIEEYNKVYGIKSNASAVKATNATVKDKADEPSQGSANANPKKNTTSNGALTEGTTMNGKSTSIAEGAK